MSSLCNKFVSPSLRSMALNGRFRIRWKKQLKPAQWLKASVTEEVPWLMRHKQFSLRCRIGTSVDIRLPGFNSRVGTLVMTSDFSMGFVRSPSSQKGTRSSKSCVAEKMTVYQHTLLSLNQMK